MNPNFVLELVTGLLLGGLILVLGLCLRAIPDLFGLYFNIRALLALLLASIGGILGSGLATLYLAFYSLEKQGPMSDLLWGALGGFACATMAFAILAVGFFVGLLVWVGYQIYLDQKLVWIES